MAPTTKTVSILNIHGIGEPGPDFAVKAMGWLGTALAKRNVDLRYTSAHYDPILSAPARAFQADQAARGMDAYQKSTNLVDQTLADATAYAHAPGVREKVFQVVDRAYLRLRSDDVILIGHSLGCLVALEWLVSRQAAPVGGLITMACNTPLFYLGATFPRPKQLTGGKFLNVVDKDDALGACLEGITPDAIDLKVKLQGWLSWTGLSHTAYWSSSRLWGKTLPPFIDNF